MGAERNGQGLAADVDHLILTSAMVLVGCCRGAPPYSVSGGRNPAQLHSPGEAPGVGLHERRGQGGFCPQRLRPLAKPCSCGLASAQRGPHFLLQTPRGAFSNPPKGTIRHPPSQRGRPARG